MTVKIKNLHILCLCESYYVMIIIRVITSNNHKKQISHFERIYVITGVFDHLSLDVMCRTRCDTVKPEMSKHGGV